MAGEAERDLGRLEGRVEGLATAFDNFRDDNQRWREELRADMGRVLDAHAGHGKRLRRLELAHAGAVAVLATLAFVWGVVQVVMNVAGWLWKRG